MSPAAGVFADPQFAQLQVLIGEVKEAIQIGGTRKNPVVVNLARSLEGHWMEAEYAEGQYLQFYGKWRASLNSRDTRNANDANKTPEAVLQELVNELEGKGYRPVE